jgi:hypothetical protein
MIELLRRRRAASARELDVTKKSFPKGRQDNSENLPKISKAKKKNEKNCFLKMLQK